MTHHSYYNIAKLTSCYKSGTCHLNVFKYKKRLKIDDTKKNACVKRQKDPKQNGKSLWCALIHRPVVAKVDIFLRICKHRSHFLSLTSFRHLVMYLLVYELIKFDKVISRFAIPRTKFVRQLQNVQKCVGEDNFIENIGAKRRCMSSRRLKHLWRLLEKTQTM